MTRRKGVFSWENEPSGERRTGFRSTSTSDWQQSTHSTFADPSRLDRQLLQRRRRRRLGARAVGMILAVGLTLAGLAVLLARLMSR